jgi:HEAT repeat protein/energy-coupling factor transporter ATP-binding protein EcfA2
LTRKALQDHLDRLLSTHHYVDFRGIRHLGKAVELELDEIFVPLRMLPLPVEENQDEGAEPNAHASQATPPSGHADSRLDRASEPIPIYSKAAAQRRENAPASTPDQNNATIDSSRKLLLDKSKPFEQLFRRHRQLVLLGDPGCGKTTLLKWLARTYALGEEAVQERLGLTEKLVPLLVSAVGYAQSAANTPDDPPTLVEYLGMSLELPEAPELIKRGRALVLLDGLDEVPSARVRERTVREVNRLLRRCADDGTSGSRCVVTSRLYGYRNCRITDAEPWQIAPFTEPQIRQFIKAWSWGLERTLRPAAPSRAKAEQEAESLAGAIFGTGSAHPDTLHSFAENPLLLAIIALVKRQFERLPDLRVELYEIALKTLFETWSFHRSLAGPLQRHDPNVQAEQTMQLWEPVALWMHEECPGGTAHRDEILRRLAVELRADSDSDEEAWTAAESWLDGAARWAGVLLERGPDRFGFMHQTFQEHLAGRALVREAEHPYDALQRYFLTTRWREVVLLAAGFMGATQGRTMAVSRLVDELRRTTDTLEPYLHRHLLLAAAILGERVPVRRSVFEAVRRDLIEVCHGTKNVAAVGEALASLHFVPPNAETLRVATGTFPKIWRWELSVALLLQWVRSPEKADGLLRLGMVSDDANVAQTAAVLLAETGKNTQKVYDRLFNPLVSESKAVGLQKLREQAWSDMVDSPASSEHMSGLLSRGNPWERCKAAYHLGRSKAHRPKVLKKLRRLLDDKEAEVRLMAAFLLRDELSHVIKAQGTLAALAAIHPDRMTAARVLCNARTLHPETIRTLEEMLAADSSYDVLLSAAVLLNHGVNKAEALEVLHRLLSDEDNNIRFHAARHLQEAGEQLEEAQQVFVAIVEEEAGYDEKSWTALYSADTLVRETRQSLASLLDSTNAAVRDRAAHVLTIKFDPSEHKAHRVLAKQMRISPDVYHARPLLRADGYSQEARETLQQICTNGSSWERMQAVNGLLETADDEDSAVALVQDQIDNDDPRTAIFMAGLALEFSTLHAAAEQKLLSYLKDEDPGNRFEAAYELAKHLEREGSRPLPSKRSSRLLATVRA